MKYTFALFAGPARVTSVTCAGSLNLLLPIALQTAGIGLDRPIA